MTIDKTSLGVTAAGILGFLATRAFMHNKLARVVGQAASVAIGLVGATLLYHGRSDGSSQRASFQQTIDMSKAHFVNKNYT